MRGARRAFAAILSGLAAWQAAAATEPDGDVALSGEVLAVAQGNHIRYTLNPGNIIRQPDRVAEAAARVKVSFPAGAAVARVSRQRQRSNGAHHYHDDVKLQKLYKSFDLADGIELTLGKKNIHLDHGFSYHPLDFFEDLSIALDPDDRQGRETGFPLAAVSFGRDQYRWSIVVSDDTSAKPRAGEFNRDARQLMARLHLLKAGMDANIVVQKYEAGRIGGGGSISLTPTASLELHAAMFTRRGTRRPIHESVYTGRPDVFGPDTDPVRPLRTTDSTWYPRLLVGGQWTSDSSVNVLIEYIYDARGMSRQQWDTYLRLLSLHQGLASAPLRSLNLAYDAKALLTRRQHYVFAKVQFGDLPLKPEIGALIGQDYSASWSVRLSHAFQSNVSAWLDYRVNTGSKSSEFGLVPTRQTLVLGAKYVW